MDALLYYLILLVAGLVAGLVNILAGGGSFLTLPILIFLGLPAVTANGTNRLAIMLQNSGAVWGFQRHRVLDWSSLKWAALPSGLGSLVGVWLAFSVADATFKRLLAFLMIALTLWTLWDPVSRRAGRLTRRTGGAVLFIGFFLVGIYGGFVQAGVGFLVLALTTYSGLDLIRGNAVKVLIILFFTGISLILFAWQGEVVWTAGLVLGVGSVLGGLIGVHLTVLKGHKWVKSCVTVAIIVFAIKLWISG